ncbi:isocitrate lyase/PEP mutase family protein [Azospirillum palustre]
MTMPDLSFKQRLSEDRVVLAPGVYDAFTASMATTAGFEALYLSGAAIAYTRLGRPDIGLVSVSEVADTIALVRDRVPTPLIVDADTGYGNALNVQRTVRMFERAGATALQLEDQSFPKRCGHLTDKAVIPAGEMAGKIKAAVDARTSEGTLIVARTDAVAVEGVSAALDRARLYVEAGADVLFVEAPKSREQLSAIASDLGGIRPLLANMVEGGQTPISSAADLAELGYRLVIFPGGIVRALARQAQDYYGSLAQHGTTQPFRDRMFDFNALNDLIGTPEMLALGEAYKDFGKDSDPAKREDAA